MSGGAVWWWLLATLSISQATEDATFSVNTKTYSHVVSDRFLSITIDPTLLMNAEYSAGITKVINLARGLAPAYVRLGSPASNRYQFLKAGTHRQHNASYAITEAQWMILNDFAQKSGLEPIVCVNIMSRQSGTGAWDTRNLRDLVAYSDRRKYKLSWQFGYELQQHRHRWSGTELGSDLKTLRDILDTYPRYRQSKILAPDITSTDDPADVEFLKDFLETAGDALTAVTWHAFESDNNTRSGEETNTLAVRENHLADKLGTGFTSKPLWIAESYRDPGEPSRFEDGLSWALELGEAAKMGIQTVLKRPQIHNLQTPTPDYWVSFLHKTLVGELVLANDWGPSAGVQMFSHCANTRRPAANVFVSDQLRYEQGSVAFFGVNRLSAPVDVLLRLGALTKRGRDVELHEYVLTRDDAERTGSQVPKVLLNGRRLSLDFTGRLPILTPKVHHYNNKMTLTLPGSSVAFWVVSGAKARACLSLDGEALQRRVRRSATAESTSEGTADEAASRHNETQVIKRKSVTGSQIVMEIGNWEEMNAGEEIVGGKNNSEKDIADQSVATQRSSDGKATEVQIITPELTDEQLGNNEENNATHLNHVEELKENTERPKYHISKVLVVFENESGDHGNEDGQRALLVDEDTVISDEKEFSRVSRALEKDAFTVPSSALSLLDMAALRGPLLSLKRLRERRWEKLQRKKLLAGQQYKKALGLQASMLFPKRSLMQPNEERRGDYDYVTEEDEPEADEYMQQYPGQGQWTLLGDLHNGKNVAKPNGGAPTTYEQLWEMERGAIDGSHFKERQRHIRENANGNANGIPICIKESAQRGSPEDTFAYGTRNERVPEVFANKEQSHDIMPHYETQLRESAKFQCLEEADTSKRRSTHEKGLTEHYEGGINPTHDEYGDAYHQYVAPGLQYTPQVADYKRAEAVMLRTSHGRPSYRQEQLRNRRHLTGSVDTSQNHVLAVNHNQAKEEITTATLAINDDNGKESEIMEVTTAALAFTDDKDKESEIKDVTLAANDNEDKERDRKDVSAVDDNGDKDHDTKDVSAAAEGSTVERDVEGLMSGQDGAEPTATVDSDERNARDGDTEVKVGSAYTLTSGHDEHLQSAVQTDTAEKDIRKIPLPTLIPILKTHPLIKPLTIPKLPLPNLVQSRHLDENTDTTLENHKGVHVNIGKLAHLLSDIKSRTHKRIEELKRKTLRPKARPKATAKIHSIAHLKETLKTEENNLKEKVDAIIDDAVSLRNADAFHHLQAADETHAPNPEKRSSIESAQNLVKERIKMLLDAVATHLDQEPSIFERSAELKAAPQGSKHVKLTEPDHNEEEEEEKPHAERDQEGEATEAPANRKRRHANYDVGRFNRHSIESTYPDQHSKKRFLKIKELQVLDSPKDQGNVNHRAKSADRSRGRNTIGLHVHDSSALGCAKPTQESNADIDTQANSGQGSSKCVRQPDNLLLKTVARDLSKISSDTDESELNYRTKTIALHPSSAKPMAYNANSHKQAGQSSINTIALHSSSRKPMSYNENSHKPDGHGSKSWHLKNIDSNSWESGGPVSGNVNGGFMSGYSHMTKPIPHNENQIDVNKRSKRYIELFSGEIDSDEFLNQRLGMVDSNSNQDVSKNELKRKLSSVEKMPRFANLQKLKRTEKVRGDNVNREFKDWNLALSSQGLQIEAETFRNDVDKGNTKYGGDGNHATNLATEGDKVFPSKEPKRAQKHHYSGNDEASQKLGFFGNILKKIYSLFHSLFDTTLK